MSDLDDPPDDEDQPDDEPDDDEPEDDRLDLGYDGPLPELRAMVSLFSKPEFGIGLTLQVGGLLVSGVSVPRATWLRALAGRDRPAEIVTNADAVAWALHEVAVEAALEADIDSGVQSDKVEEVYLVDVVVESSMRRSEFKAYQVQLSAVDAWTLGQSATPGS